MQWHNNHIIPLHVCRYNTKGGQQCQGIVPASPYALLFPLACLAMKYLAQLEVYQFKWQVSEEPSPIINPLSPPSVLVNNYLLVLL